MFEGALCTEVLSCAHEPHESECEEPSARPSGIIEAEREPGAAESGREPGAEELGCEPGAAARSDLAGASNSATAPSMSPYLPCVGSASSSARAPRGEPLLELFCDWLLE